MTRGKLAKALDINPETIRYYEGLDLIKPQIDSKTGYRYYNESLVKKLDLIINFKSFGFTLKEIKAFFDYLESNDYKSDDFHKYLDKKITEIENRINGLKAIKESLIQFRDKKDKETCEKFSSFIKSP